MLTHEHVFVFACIRFFLIKSMYSFLAFTRAFYLAPFSKYPPKSPF